MRYTLGGDGGFMRRCTINERKSAYLPNAYTLGSGKYKAERGDLVHVRTPHEEFVGRVLGQIEDYPLQAHETAHDAVGRLLVLGLSPTGQSTFVRWVRLNEILECHTVEHSTDLVEWFFQTKLPPADVVMRMLTYGTLSTPFIADKECGPEDIRGRGRRTFEPRP